MNGLPYYKRYPRDFVEGTIGLPFEVKATYSFVLDLIYMQGGELPDDPRYISGLLGVSVRKWNALRQALIDHGKIQVSGEFLTNYRAVSELESLAKLQDKQRENRSRPNKNKDLQSPRSNHTEPEPDTEVKETTNVVSKKPDQRKRKSRLSDDWRLPKEWGEWALGKGLDELSIRREADQFKDHHLGHGTTMLEWKRGWQTWVRNALKWQKKPQRTSPSSGAQDAGSFGMLPEVG